MTDIAQQPMPHQSQGMRIAVIGPGALGTLFAARLARAQISTILFDHRADRAALLTAQGLRAISARGEETTRVAVSANCRDLQQIDVALVLVKSPATEDVAALLADHLSPTAVVCTLQNGLGNLETLQLHLGSERVFGGTTAQGALLEGPGVVRDTGGGPTMLGSPSGTADARLDDIAQALLLAGFSVAITADLQAALWNKAIINAAINPVGALTGLRNGQLAEHTPSLKTMVAAAREASRIARRHGIKLEEQDWAARLRAICQATALNRNSMLQDVLHKRRTEIDAINGAIVRIAEQYHLQVPVNRTLCYLVRAIELGYHEA